MKVETYLETYLGQEISLTTDHKLRVTWADETFKGEKSVYSTMDAAKEAIKKGVAVTGALMISVPVTTTLATPATVAGINRTNSDLRGPGLGTRDYSDPHPYVNGIYPRDESIAWVAEMVAWAVSLQAWSDHFWGLLKPLRIGRSVGYGRLAIEDLPDNLEEFEARWKRNLGLAQQGPQAVAEIVREERR